MIRDAAKSVLDMLHHRIYVPSHAWASIRRRRPHGRKLDYGSVEEHLRAAVDWIFRAHLAVEEEGVAARYTFRDGWLSAYPETTGYIIPTLFAYSRFSNDTAYRNMAYRMADWLMACQFEEGGFPGGHLDQKKGPVVFNTGQILLGLVEAFYQSGDEEYLEAARGAGQWLTGIQDEDGAWRRFTYGNRFHAYHTRVAWPLIDLGMICDEDAFVDAGKANLDFALTLQQENGWFSNNTLDDEAIPFTHTLAYVSRGMLEGGLLLADDTYLESAYHLAYPLLADFEMHRFLPGQFDRDMEPITDFSCLTGSAQMSVVWQKLGCLCEDDGEATRFLDGARRINRQVMHCQDLHCNNPGIRGAVPGSWPMSGPYIRYGYPNWAAKFLADALMFEMEIQTPQHGPASCTHCTECAQPG